MGPPLPAGVDRNFGEPQVSTASYTESHLHNRRVIAESSNYVSSRKGSHSKMPSNFLGAHFQGQIGTQAWNTAGTTDFPP